MSVMCGQWRVEEDGPSETIFVHADCGDPGNQPCTIPQGLTLADLLVTLERKRALGASRGKDKKTALRYLAAALGYTSLAHARVAAVLAQQSAWGDALRAYFERRNTDGKPSSPSTRRNTRNGIRKVFRAAHAHGLVPLPLREPILGDSQPSVFVRQPNEMARQK